MFDFQTATLSALSTSLCWKFKVLASLTSCIWNKSRSQSQRSSVSSCSLPPRDTHRPWHRFCKSTHTRSAVIAYFLTSFNSSGAPGVTRHGLLSYTWPGWVTPLALKPQICFFPSSSALSYMGSVFLWFSSQMLWKSTWIISACAGESSHSVFNQVSI